MDLNKLMMNNPAFLQRVIDTNAASLAKELGLSLGNALTLQRNAAIISLKNSMKNKKESYAYTYPLL